MTERNDFERDALLDEAERIIRLIKEQVGEHGEPDSDHTRVWLGLCNDWIEGFTAVKVGEDG